jgi:hypothetical protein
MSNDVHAFAQREVRGADSNSLLRMYDLANEYFKNSQFQQERARAGRAIQRIAKELQRRNVPLSGLRLD